MDNAAPAVPYAGLNLDAIRETLAQPVKPEVRREPMSIITVRMPRRLHGVLLQLAQADRRSLNRYCVDGLHALAKADVDAIENVRNEEAAK